jgi:Domain of unknown function (DUF4234)
MAHDVRIEATGKSAKVRNPWLVLLFVVLTVGIYGAFWWYFVNREMVDLGRSRNTGQLGTNAGQSTAAYVLGSFIYVPTIWTIVTTNQRIRRAQRLTVGLTHRAWLAWLLWIFTLSLGGFVYMQYELNRVWRAPGMRPLDPQDANQATLASGDAERLDKLIGLHGAEALSDAEFAAERTRLGL